MRPPFSALVTPAWIDLARRPRLSAPLKRPQRIVALSKPAASGPIARVRCYCSMEQRRFFEVRGEESGEWLVLDGKRHPPRVICRCLGWSAPKNAALIAAALEAHNSELYSKFPLDGSGLPNEQPVKASGAAKSVPAPKPATGKSRARHRG
jgi:hypothetical protein